MKPKVAYRKHVNQYVYNQLSSGYQELYQLSTQQLIHADLKDLLDIKIKEIREQLRVRSKSDPLQRKLMHYGNGGKWGHCKSKDLFNQIYEDKTPDNEDLGQWVSVEIECIMLNKAKEKLFIKEIRNLGFNKYVTLKDDGSVYPDSKIDDEACCMSGDEDGNDCGDCEYCNLDEYGREIVVTFKYGNWELVKQICKALNACGAYVNKTCGLHVHFDFRNSKRLLVSKMGHRIAKCVPALYKMLPKSRRDNSYCKVAINHHTRGERYAFVNLQSYSKHRTLEIRGHSGTTDPVKIINWIRLMKYCMDYKGKPLETIDELVNQVKMPEDLMEYCVQRSDKFVKEQSGDDIQSDNNSPVQDYTYDTVLNDLIRRGESIIQANAPSSPPQPVPPHIDGTFIEHPIPIPNPIEYQMYFNQALRANLIPRTSIDITWFQTNDTSSNEFDVINYEYPSLNTGTDNE